MLLNRTWTIKGRIILTLAFGAVTVVWGFGQYIGILCFGVALSHVQTFSFPSNGTWIKHITTNIKEDSHNPDLRKTQISEKEINHS